MSCDSLQSQFDSVLQEAEQRTRDIEQYAKDHVEDTPECIERELKQRLHNFRIKISEQLSDIEASILQHKPEQNDPDYNQKKALFKEFMTGACSAIKEMTQMLENLLSRLGEIIAQIVNWIIQNLPAILSAITVLFEHVILPLMKAKQN
jgi:phage-related protein